MTRCDVCKQPLGKHRMMLEVPGQPGKSVTVHSACFWKARAEFFEAMFNQAHQLNCCLVAGRGGYTRVMPDDMKKAQEAKYKLTPNELPDKSVELRLGDAVILPPEAALTLAR